MSRYDDYRSSTGALDERFPRDRHERHYSRPPVAERLRREEDERFEFRLRNEDRYGPPARRPDRHYEDDHLIHTSGPLVAYDRRPVESPPRPRLLRRQSSLDTFDRIPARKRDKYHRYESPPRVAHVPLPPRRPSPPRHYHERDFYEDIRIAEPEYYGDEEFREIHDRRHRSHSRAPRYRERVVEDVKIEKPYPRKGKTRMPRKLVHTRAIIELGYPFQEEDDVVIIQKALSKEQIDEVISVSREIRRTETRIIRTSPSPSPIRERTREKVRERIIMDSHSPRSSRDALLIEASPSRSRHRSRTRYRRELIDRREVRNVSRPRSASVHVRHRRPSSPVRIRRDDFEDGESDKLKTSPLAIVVRPKHSDDDLREYIRELEEEKRMLQLERLGIDPGVDIIQKRDTKIIDSNGDREEVLEVRKDRKGRVSLVRSKDRPFFKRFLFI